MALRLLGRRDRSEAELRQRLARDGIADGDAQAVVDRLKALGYLDDRRFARQFCEAAIRDGRMFGWRLRRELGLRGIDGELADEALAVAAAGRDEGDAIRAILTRRFAGFEPARATDREKQRVFAYLRRRGFMPAAILDSFRGAGER